MNGFVVFDKRGEYIFHRFLFYLDDYNKHTEHLTDEQLNMVMEQYFIYSYNSCHDDKRVKEMFDDKVKNAWDKISHKVVEDAKKYDEAQQCA
jgi:hypothetical protein